MAKYELSWKDNNFQKFYSHDVWSSIKWQTNGAEHLLFNACIYFFLYVSTSVHGHQVLSHIASILNPPIWKCFSVIIIVHPFQFDARKGIISDIYTLSIKCILYDFWSVSWTFLNSLQYNNIFEVSWEINGARKNNFKWFHSTCFLAFILKDIPCPSIVSLYTVGLMQLVQIFYVIMMLLSQSYMLLYTLLYFNRRETIV